MDWIGVFLALLTILFAAIVGYVFDMRRRKLEKKDEQDEAVAALRYELQQNFEWLDNIFDTRIYLRDEAWVILKNKGYISYLSAPIPLEIIHVYEKLHLLNEEVRVLRDDKQNFDSAKAEKAKNDLGTEITKVIGLLDSKYRNIGENFKRA